MLFISLKKRKKTGN